MLLLKSLIIFTGSLYQVIWNFMKPYRFQFHRFPLFQVPLHCENIFECPLVYSNEQQIYSRPHFILTSTLEYVETSHCFIFQISELDDLQSRVLWAAKWIGWSYHSAFSQKSCPLAPTPSVNLSSPGHNTYVVIIPFRVATRKVHYPSFGIW